FERNVGRREDARLSVVNAQALDVRQIADAAGDGDVNVIFDAASLGAIAHPQIRVALVGAERHEYDLCAALYSNSRHFGEFNVVTHLDRDFAFVRIEHFDAVAALDAPPVFLGRRDV